MAVDLARYIVSLEAQSAKYQQELDKASRKLDRFHKDQERALSKIKSAFIGLGATLAAVFSVRAIVNFTKASIDMADQLGETAKAAGLSAKTLQELRVAFDQLGGIASGETDSGLQRFNRTLGLAINGSRQAQQQFKLLGVAFKDSLGRGVTTGAALETTLQALGRIENDAQRAAIAGQLFGRELGPKLAAALKGGSQAMDEARAQVTGIISDESVRKASALDDAFKRIAHTVGGPLKEAAIATAFEISKIFGFVEDAPEDVLAKRIAEAKGELELIKKSLLAPFSLSENVQKNQIERARQLQQTIQVLEAAAAASAQVSAQAVSESVVAGFNDGLSEITTAFGKLPADLKKFDFAGAINTAAFQELSSVVVKMPDDLRKIPPEINSAIAALATYADGLSKADEKQKDLAESMGRGFRDTLTDVFLGVERSFSDLLKRMAAEMFTSVLFSGLASLFAGSTTGIGKFFGNFFGGHLAEGGPLTPGKWHIAGEHGPEPVWGGGAGAFAMGYAGGGGDPSAVVYQTNHFNGGNSDEMSAAMVVNNERLMRTMEAKLRQERNRRRF